MAEGEGLFERARNWIFHRGAAQSAETAATPAGQEAPALDPKQLDPAQRRIYDRDPEAYEEAWRRQQAFRDQSVPSTPIHPEGTEEERTAAAAQRASDIGKTIGG